MPSVPSVTGEPWPALSKEIVLAEERRRDGARQDLRKADHRHEIVVRDLAVVELPEEGRHLVGAPDLGIVVLDLARRELTECLHLDLVDHGVEDPLARAVPAPAQ